MTALAVGAVAGSDSCRDGDAGDGVAAFADACRKKNGRLTDQRCRSPINPCMDQPPGESARAVHTVRLPSASDEFALQFRGDWISG